MLDAGCYANWRNQWLWRHCTSWCWCKPGDKPLAIIYVPTRIAGPCLKSAWCHGHKLTGHERWQAPQQERQREVLKIQPLHWGVWPITCEIRVRTVGNLSNVYWSRLICHSQLHSNGLIFNSLWEDHKPDHPAGLNANYAGRIALWREQWWVFCFVIPMLTVSGFQLMCHVAGCWRHIQFWNSVAQYRQTNLQVSSKKYCQWSNSRVNKDQVWYTSNSMWVSFSGLCWLQEFSHLGFHICSPLYVCILHVEFRLTCVVLCYSWLIP